MKTEIDRLDQLFDLRSLRRGELLSRLDISEGNVDDGYTYENLVNLEKAHDSGQHSAHFYFDGDELVMIYISDQDFLNSVTIEKLRSSLGDPPLELASRAGKRSTLSVYPRVGLAVSYQIGSDSVEFAEIFPTTTAEIYERDIYNDPGPFRK